MKTSANRDLFAYWSKMRGDRLAPERGDIEPDAIRHMLGDSFFLAAGPSASFPFRLAGTRLCALFGRELKNESFFNLWGAADQAVMRKLISAIVDEKVGVVAQATGRTIGAAPLIVNLELLMLPLLQRGPLDARVLGALVPIGVPFWLGARFIGSLELGSLRHIGAPVEEVRAPRLVPSPTPLPGNGRLRNPAPVSPERNPQNRGRFVVYDGGRTD
jgi:hypothetical protein